MQRTFGTILRISAASIMALSVGLSVGAAPAAAATPTTDFKVYGPDHYFGNGGTQGRITWYNRSVFIPGVMYADQPLSVTVFFEAYAGDVKVDSDTRTVRRESGLTS